ncbi:Na+/H+ antiporter NhaA [Nocardia farcinica]|uniref:Na+/H+ antiporter NhaA n=1 Tax=Nocardia farcinica TaxID=37329 RepID=UPI000A3C2200|nr:Na+/H+ antiporter NhaA [Nocardia farcinica]MBF6068037.1 Na+/H+ antiporter NhaA [Nocardia farcinica]MBF6255450.1 Na+/H+ antiporter NhaA [Nocardia farcinica]MBF6261448.1 Na+/H+ antiporter NhaA [Nocardia farcinica]MBF6267824.1 Na+/H+ antiporter NhaA [Nocardia farcinica]MBF6278883.1 Na+/H+ antiporter NhaA [Nocardia farcinica]
MTSPHHRPRLLSRGSWPEARRISGILRTETAGGALLIAAAAIGLIWANTPWSDAYERLRDFQLGPSALHLNLALETWAADGLLAVFFFVVGLELKREFVAGDLRDPRRAALPVAAAVGGMIVPALLYFAVNVGNGTAVNGWAIPTATDIAFALAILAVVSSHLPTALRTFLLTLAVVDDLLAVTVIAVFYTDDLDLLYLGLALLPLAGFAVAVQRGVHTFWVLLPLAALTWWLVHESGVHATVAGVLLGFTVPVLAKAGRDDSDHGAAERFEHRIRPLSAGFAVPVFAFFAAGVTIGGLDGLVDSLTDRVTLGIVVGLVAGKALGIVATTFLTAKLTRAELDDELSWLDVAGVALLGGIGFTVSLLIGELAFAGDPTREDHVRIGVLVGTLTAALLATILLRSRNRVYRRIAELESRDDDHDGIPDVYQHPK